MSAAAEAELTNPVLKVGESSIFEAEAKQVIQNMRTQSMTQVTQREGAPELAPFEYLSIYMQAMSQLTRQAAVLEIGRKAGVKVEEDQMRSVISQMNVDQLNQQRQQFDFMQAMQIGPMQAQIEKLKKDKAPVEQIAEAEKALNEAQNMTFDKMFQQQQNMTPQEFVDKQSEEIVTMASRDPVVARGIVATAIQQELSDKYAQGIDTSDAALKASYRQSRVQANHAEWR